MSSHHLCQMWKDAPCTQKKKKKKYCSTFVCFYGCLGRWDVGLPLHFHSHNYLVFLFLLAAFCLQWETFYLQSVVMIIITKIKILVKQNKIQKVDDKLPQNDWMVFQKYLYFVHVIKLENTVFACEHRFDIAVYYVEVTHLLYYNVLSKL